MDYSQHSFANRETDEAWQEMSFRMQRPEIPLFHCDLEPWQYAWAVLLLDAMKRIEDASDNLASKNPESRMDAARLIASEYLSSDTELQQHVAKVESSLSLGYSGGSVTFYHNARLAILSASAILPALRLVDQHEAAHTIHTALTHVIHRCEQSGCSKFVALGSVLASLLDAQQRSVAES